MAINIYWLLIFDFCLVIKGCRRREFVNIDVVVKTPSFTTDLFPPALPLENKIPSFTASLFPPALP